MFFSLDTSLEQLRKRLAVGAERAVLATLIRTHGSTYRKFGARMLLEPDGRLTGLLSGGCLEHDLLENARHVMDSGRPLQVQYDHRGEDDPVFGIGAGCEGAMDILLEPVHQGSRARDALNHVFADCDTHGHAPLFLVTDSAHPEFGTHGPHQPPQVEPEHVLIDTIAPPPTLLIAGAGVDVHPLVRLVDTLHWRAEIVDHRLGLLSHEAFQHLPTHHAPGRRLPDSVKPERYCAAVVMSHHLESDRAYLTALARTTIPYIGLLGPKARRERLLALLTDSDREALCARLHAPVGLDIGAVTPEGIALSIMSQLHSFASQFIKSTHP